MCTHVYLLCVDFSLTFTSAKDPSWKKYPQRMGKSACCMFTVVNYEWFRKFENTSPGNRDPEYERIKEAIGKKLVDGLVRLYPQVKEHITYVDFATPLTMKHYFGVSLMFFFRMYLPQKRGFFP